MATCQDPLLVACVHTRAGSLWSHTEGPNASCLSNKEATCVKKEIETAIVDFLSFLWEVETTNNFWLSAATVRFEQLH